MSHEHAWMRLPDLLFDRDEPELLAHVAGCHDCQRQLFLLGRVDRLLRAAANAHRKERRRLRGSRWFRFPAGLVAAVSVAAVLLLFLPGHVVSHQFTLLDRADASNLSLSFVARGLPTRAGTMYLLWAGDGARAMTVGRFMVDAHSSCQAGFNLPAGHRWLRFWVTPPGSPGEIVAAT